MDELPNDSKWLLVWVDLHDEINKLAPILGDGTIEKLEQQGTRSVIDLVSLASTRYSDSELTEQEKERISTIYEYLPLEAYDSLGKSSGAHAFALRTLLEGGAFACVDNGFAADPNDHN